MELLGEIYLTNIYIGIDPSINGNAFALLDPEHNILIPHKFNVKTGSKDWIDKLRLNFIDFSVFISAMAAIDIHHASVKPFIVVEQPEKQNSAKGKHAYETNKYVKLCAAFGATIVGIGQYMHPKLHTLWTPTPSQWKGQVPKAITQKRMLRNYGHWHPALESKTHDEFDALGLADWAYAKNEPLSHRELAKTGNDS